MAALSSGTVLRPLDCCYCVFEPRSVMDIFLFDCCVLSDVELITRPEAFYRMRCLSVIVKPR